jgi:hypothetical protein
MVFLIVVGLRVRRRENLERSASSNHAVGLFVPMDEGVKPSAALFCCCFVLGATKLALSRKETRQTEFVCLFV